MNERIRTQRLLWPVGIALVTALPLVTLLAGCGSGNRTISVPSPTPTPVATPTPSSSATPPPVATGSLTPPYAGKVVFVSRRGADERDALYVMNPDGSQITALTQLSSIDSGNFNLLYPDTHFMNAAGTKFLLTFDYGTGSGSINILVNADGTGATNISALLDPEADNSSSSAYGHVADVSMNAAGTQFVFPYVTFKETDNSTNYALTTLNTDGTARTTRYTAPANQQIISPIFAPDGQTIYFVQAASGEDSISSYSGGIYRLAAGATMPTLVTPLAVQSINDIFVFPSLSISADGTRLAFTNNVNSAGAEIFTINTDGTGLKQLTTAAGVNTTPAFTADGTKIVFVSYRDGNAELYSINPDGTGETRLTYQIEPDNQPVTRAVAKRAALLRSRRAAAVKTTSQVTNKGKAAR